MAETAALLADEVLPERPLRQWVLSLPYALRFLLATDPDSLTLVLRTVYRAISGCLLKKAGLTRATGFPGAVTLIQRFGSALNLNIHFHMIFLDGVYVPVEGAAPVFRHVPAPTGTELQELVQQSAARIGKVLEQRGIVERDMENAWLAMQGEGGPLDDLIGHSITYRIAVGPRAGQKLSAQRSFVVGLDPSVLAPKSFRLASIQAIDQDVHVRVPAGGDTEYCLTADQAAMCEN
jgi:Putative transposase